VEGETAFYLGIRLRQTKRWFINRGLADILYQHLMTARRLKQVSNFLQAVCA